jgi:ring-1,2-phenylacetyl-CoA epoxidase subunit PaaD
MDEVLKQRISELLEQVKDPELPAVSIVELGIFRNARVENGALVVELTPTYSACPAMKVIVDEVRAVLERDGLKEVVVREVYAPAWTSDWITEEGRRKLKEYGIAPPAKASAQSELVFFPKEKTILCPHCDSSQTRLQSTFGSTSCKALYYCDACHQPFEYFKEI